MGVTRGPQSSRSGSGDREGTPPPHITVRCKRYKSGETLWTDIVDAQNHTKSIEPRPQKALGDRQAYDHLFKQTTTYTQQHIHGISHGTLHSTDTPLILFVRAGVVRTEKYYSITGTPPHSPTASHPPTTYNTPRLIYKHPSLGHLR